MTDIIKKFKDNFLELKEGNSNHLDIANRMIEAISTFKPENIPEEPLEKVKKQVNSINSTKIYSECFNDSGNTLLVYTLSRAVGGICSTGTEYRNGFSILLDSLVETHSDNINFDKLIEAINKESYFKKTEVPAIKNAQSSGKVFCLSSILKCSNPNAYDIKSRVFTQLISLVEQQSNTEELVIKALNSFLFGATPNDLNSKKFQKLIENVISQWLTKEVTQTFHASLILTLSIYVKKNPSTALSNFINNFMKTKTKYVIENFLFNIENPQIPQGLVSIFNFLVDKNKNHIVFDLLLQFLAATAQSDFKFLAISWNCITDKEVGTELIKKSNKNYQFLLTKLSLCLIENVADIARLREIFDLNYFRSFLHLEGGKQKITYLTQIIGLLTKRMGELQSDEGKKEKKKSEHYSSEVLKLFNHKELSSISFRGFFIFLFGNLNENSRTEYLTTLLSPTMNDSKKDTKMDIDDLNEDMNEEDYRAEFYSKVNILKTLIIVSN